MGTMSSALGTCIWRNKLSEAKAGDPPLASTEACKPTRVGVEQAISWSPDNIMLQAWSFCEESCIELLDAVSGNMLFGLFATQDAGTHDPTETFPIDLLGDWFSLRNELCGQALSGDRLFALRTRSKSWFTP